VPIDYIFYVYLCIRTNKFKTLITKNTIKNNLENNQLKIIFTINNIKFFILYDTPENMYPINVNINEINAIISILLYIIYKIKLPQLNNRENIKLKIFSLNKNIGFIFERNTTGNINTPIPIIAINAEIIFRKYEL
jgi:hypothetical protein